MHPRDLIADKARRLSPYVPGKTVEEIARDEGMDPATVVKLSSNENPLGPSPSAIDALRDLTDLHRYPSPPLVESVEQAAADHAGLSPDNVTVTPGADGSLDYLCRLLIENGDIAAAPVPTFQYYRPPIVVNGGDFLPVETDPDQNYAVTTDVVQRALDHDPKILFLCTPNNPTGGTVPRDALDLALDGDRIVILDEAYGEFADRNHAALVKEHDNLVILRTLSKAFGLAGLRVGYSLAPTWVKEEIGRVATPFSVSTAGLVAARAALQDRDHLTKSLEIARAGREHLAEHVPFRALPTQANFVAFDVSPHSAADVEAHMRSRGILVRNCASFPGDTDHLLRITAGTEEENRKAAEAAESFLDTR